MTTSLAHSLVHIVEDDDAVQLALSLLIESRGGRVKAYRSAEDFLVQNAVLEEPPLPACMLLDLNLGGKSGAELLEQLRRDQSPLPVIVITAHPESALGARATQAGALKVIEKPFESGQILQAITEALALA